MFFFLLQNIFFSMHALGFYSDVCCHLGYGQGWYFALAVTSDELPDLQPNSRGLYLCVCVHAYTRS